MTGWQFQYWNGSAWVNFANAQVDHILEELSSVGGQEELSFILPNTAANRTIIQGKPFVQALFGGTIIFPLANQNAIATSRQSTPTQILVTAYNYIFVLLSQASSTVTQTYTNTAVATIAAYICGIAGVPVGSMPALNVSIKFNNANCFTAMADLAKACGADYWADTAFNIGTRDSTTQTLGYVGNNTKRGIDYSKQVDQVIVNGVDSTGVQIQGSAGSPGALATFTEKKVSDIATLNNIAAFQLQKLNNPSNGNSLECLISQVATWHPGQYVSANRPDLELVGSFIIQRITKQAVSCSVEVDAAMPQMDLLLQDTDQYADLGTYQTQPTTQTPTALVLQGLAHLYHLTEGVGTAAIDSTPNGTPSNGVITGGTWVNGAIPGTKVINFSGTGYVDAPNTDVLGNTLAIGCWYSPSSLIDHGAMIGKANNFLLEISGTSGAIRFGVHIGGSWVYLTAPAGTIKANGRGFAIGVYDGTNMYLYVANPNVVNQLLTYSQGQTGSLDSSSADLYIGGASFNGVVAEVMIWTRALSAQEVQELFFRPLTRIIAKGTTATLTGNAQPGDVIQGQTFYNTDPTNKLTGTLSWAFTKGLRVQQKLTLLLQQITTKIKDHVCQMTRTLVLKILTTGANDHTCTMTRTKSLTLYVTKWFVDIDSQQAALGSTDHEGLNVVNSGSTLTFTATPNLANNYILKMTNTFMFDTTLVTATSIQTVSPYAGTYTIPAQTVGTVHELKPIWLKGFIVIGGSNTTINGYNSVVSGNSISWSAVGSAGTGNHWEYYWNGIDVGRSSGSQTAADGTVNSATCAILTGT